MHSKLLFFPKVTGTQKIFKVKPCQALAWSSTYEYDYMIRKLNSK